MPADNYFAMQAALRNQAAVMGTNYLASGALNAALVTQPQATVSPEASARALNLASGSGLFYQPAPTRTSVSFPAPTTGLNTPILVGAALVAFGLWYFLK